MTSSYRTIGKSAPTAGSHLAQALARVCRIRVCPHMSCSAATRGPCATPRPEPARLVIMRGGEVRKLPDAVAFPRSSEEVQALLLYAPGTPH